MHSHDSVGEAQASYRIKLSRGLHVGGAREITTCSCEAYCLSAVEKGVQKIWDPVEARRRLRILLPSVQCVCLQAGARGKVEVSTELPLLRYLENCGDSAEMGSHLRSSRTRSPALMGSSSCRKALRVDPPDAGDDVEVVASA